MTYNPDVHHRKSIRLKDYDYSKNGMYFITICTQNRRCVLSEAVGSGLVSALQIKLSYIGNLIKKALLDLENEFNNNIKIYNYVIMPNHIHAIIEIKRADTRPAPTISDIICSFKSRTTLYILKEIKLGKIKPFNKRFWQRNYYEHVIRNEKELYKIIEYIENNPYNWKDDPNYVE